MRIVVIGSGFGGLSASAHLPQPDEAVIRFHFNDGANEAPPVTAVPVP